METLSGFPYAEVHFDSRGALIGPGQLEAATELIGSQGLTDVLVLVHGWNSTPDAARDRYGKYMAHARTLLDGELRDRFAGRRLGVIGLVWPSIPEVLQTPPVQVPLETAVDAALAAFPPDAHPQMHAALTALQGTGARPATADQLADLRTAALNEVVTSGTFRHEPMLPGDHLTVQNIDATLSRPVPASPRADVAAARAAGTASVPNLLRQLIVYASYYEMKDRAGLIGESGARGLLNDLRRAHPGVRLHLLGHSFGGRLVTAAARGPDEAPAVPVDSLHIVQGAFSHYSFAHATDSTPEGYFLRVVTEQQVRGPILITHTVKDLAVGIAYVIASALAGQDRSLRAENRYGALGSDGAQRTPVQELTLTDDLPLNFAPGTVYNLQADMIPNHGDVEQPAVVRAVLYGMLAT